MQEPVFETSDAVEELLITVIATLLHMILDIFSWHEPKLPLCLRHVTFLTVQQHPEEVSSASVDTSPWKSETNPEEPH